MLKVLNALNLLVAFLVLMGIGLVAMAEFEALDKKAKERACAVDFVGCDAPELRPAQ
ncbi:MAG: hypothetical protein H0U98_02665 [Alphaproteobacteria bacterium]|nr:hypothetical protein [Alphaproteobacteria bacterium]